MMSKLTPKDWGVTRQVEDHPMMTVHSLTIAPGGRSSWHLHERKWNAFVVTRGELSIVYEAQGKVVTQYLNVGSYLSIPPGVKHQFHNISGATVQAVEWYWPETLSEDIIRFGKEPV